MMKLAGCNVMSVGIFAWSALEPEEGRYEFEWLDRVIDGLYANGIYTILATPSGARPPWMAKKIPGSAAGGRYGDPCPVWGAA